MDNDLNCSIENSSEFFEIYNYTVSRCQHVSVWSTWFTAIICFCAVIINLALTVTIPKLIRSGQLAFKRYAYVLNLSISDIVGGAVVGVLSMVALHNGQSLFGDFIHGEF